MKPINAVIYIAVTMTSVALLSCGSFGQGFLAGMSGYGGGFYGGSPAGNVYGPQNGSMNYLLDPNYAIAQTMVQQQQFNNVRDAIARTTVQQVSTQEELEYQEFCKYNKKADGSNYTKDEWRASVGQALQSMKGNSAGSTFSTSSSSYGTTPAATSSSSSSRKCMKLSASDNAHCNGTGKCSRCNGQGKYFDTSYGISRWVSPCGACGGSGRCSTCGGDGYI